MEAKDGEEITEINKIYRTLMHFPKSSFSDLWDKSIESNKFTYYLKKLEQNGFVEKKDGKYSLTLKGKAEAVTLSGHTGKNVKRPYVALLLVPRKKGKYILYHRMKEPYYGVYGFPGAKVDFGEKILECAKRELKEEMNLEGEGKIVTIQNVLTINNGSIFAHMTQFVVLFENPEGTLITNGREGTYNWATKEEIFSQKNLFPDVKEIVENIEKREFSLKEVEFLQENEEFKTVKSTKILSIPDFI